LKAGIEPCASVGYSGPLYAALSLIVVCLPSIRGILNLDTCQLVALPNMRLIKTIPHQC